MVVENYGLTKRPSWLGDDDGRFVSAEHWLDNGRLDGIAYCGFVIAVLFAMECGVADAAWRFDYKLYSAFQLP